MVEATGIYTSVGIYQCRLEPRTYILVAVSQLLVLSFVSGLVKALYAKIGLKQPIGL